MRTGDLLSAIDGVYHAMPVYRSLVVCGSGLECARLEQDLLDADFPVTRCPADLRSRLVVATLSNLADAAAASPSAATAGACHDSVASYDCDRDRDRDSNASRAHAAVPWADFTAVFATHPQLLARLFAEHGGLLSGVRTAVVAAAR